MPRITLLVLQQRNKRIALLEAKIPAMEQRIALLEALVEKQFVYAKHQGHLVSKAAMCSV
jgi:uncharacterized coiled-coil protein SlyX